MVQNHALQLLTMIAMEPPSTSDADAIRDEKLKVLKSLKPFTAETVARDVVRGQYRAGTIDGKGVPGYLEEPKVPPGSATETFVALRTEVQNWRWAGVPFYLRTGKRLAARDAQIVVNFREVPHPIFPFSCHPPLRRGAWIPASAGMTLIRGLRPIAAPRQTDPRPARNPPPGRSVHPDPC